MGVYIKGMEMPTSCMLCPLCVEEADPANGEMCMVTGTLMPPCTRERLDDCPLAPVPPHGDLIDRREAIIDANERAYDFWLSDDEVNATIQFLKEQPTIIEAEEGET